MKARKSYKLQGCNTRNKIITWNDVRHFRKEQYILMHSVIYRTKLLRDCGLKLPLPYILCRQYFCLSTLPYVKSLYYLDVNFKRYFIGRDDQSVTEANMIKRIDQQNTRYAYND